MAIEGRGVSLAGHRDGRKTRMTLAHEPPRLVGQQVGIGAPDDENRDGFQIVEEGPQIGKGRPEIESLEGFHQVGV